MNEMFFKLPIEKQQRIINAGLEVFSKNEYKKASTEEISSKANISKGLLFHYFHNKKSYYLYLVEYAVNLVKSHVCDLHFEEVDDFFELMRYIAEKKVSILGETPYIMRFFIRAYYSKNETISEDVQVRMQDQVNRAYGTYLRNVNFNKFKEHIDTKEIYNMLIWLTEGYIYEKERVQEAVSIPDLMNHYTIWSDLLKQVSYKEEFL